MTDSSEAPPPPIDDMPYRCMKCEDVVHGQNSMWRHNEILAREEYAAAGTTVHPARINPDDDTPYPFNFFATAEVDT